MIFFSKKSALKFAATQPASAHPDFEKEALKFAFERQSRPKNFNGLSQVFIDSEGKRYFKYDDDMQLASPRLSALRICMSEIYSGLTANEFKEFLDAMEKELLNLASTKKGEVSGASKIGFLISEMKWRREELKHLELLYKLAATVYIREDEEPTIVDSAIEQEKIEQFKKDCAAGGGTWAFFFKAPIREYIPYLITSEDAWMEYLKEAELRTKATKKMMDFFTGQGSISTENKSVSS